MDDLAVRQLARAQAFLAGRGVRAFLVGGWVRDQLLGRRPRYLNADLAVPSGTFELAKAFAASAGGAFVPLDEAMGTARVVLGAEAERIEIDLCDFRGPSLDADLAKRDFTINAMAVPLAEYLVRPDRLDGLVDPLGGKAALAARRLTPCFPGTFDEDPVRILRAFRFASQLEFSLDASADPLIRAAVPALARVSGERLRDELMAIFETDRAAPAVARLDALGVLDVLIPELIPGRGLDQGPFHHLDVLAHQIEAVAQADRFLADFAEFSGPLRGPLAAYCAHQPVDRRSRKALIKLSALIHDVGKPARREIHPDGEIWFYGHEETGAELTGPIVERLKLSNREQEMVRLLVLHHLRPGFLSREPELTRRALYRFFKALGEDAPACLLEWWADRMATRGSKSRTHEIDLQRAFLESVLNAYFFRAEEVVKPPRLVSGHDLMQTFALAPGPKIGELLDAIEEAQAEGRIASAEDAMALAKALLDGTADSTDAKP